MFRKASLFPFPSHLSSPQLDQFILHFSTVLPSVALECILICGSTCAHSFFFTSEFSRLLFFFSYTIQNDEFPIKFFSYFPWNQVKFTKCKERIHLFLPSYHWIYLRTRNVFFLYLNPVLNMSFGYCYNWNLCLNCSLIRRVFLFCILYTALCWIFLY